MHSCAWYVDELYVLRQRAAVHERDELVAWGHARPSPPGRFAKAGQARLATVAGRSPRLVDLAAGV